MRKLSFAFVVLGLAATAVPAFAALATPTDELINGTPAVGSASRSNDCPGVLVWDTGMTDDFTPPTGCSSASSAGCFVNAINDGGFLGPRELADDWTVPQNTFITHVKCWARYSASGYLYHQATPGSLHGFCVKIWEQDQVNVWCPDGSLDGADAIGTLDYDQYTQVFTEFEITQYLPRNFNYCITLPTPFAAVPGKVYFVSTSADFDFTLYGDGVTQWFERLVTGTYDPYCESMWYDGWSDPPGNWNGTSVAIALPCWAGWNNGFVLYDIYVPDPWGACCDAAGGCTIAWEGDCNGTWYAHVLCDPNPCVPVPVHESSWGAIKNLYR